MINEQNIATKMECFTSSYKKVKTFKLLTEVRFYFIRSPLCVFFVPMVSASTYVRVQEGTASRGMDLHCGDTNRAIDWAMSQQPLIFSFQPSALFELFHPSPYLKADILVFLIKHI